MNAAAATHERGGLLLVVLSALAYGVMPVLAKLAYANGARATGLLAWRFLLAAAILAALGRSRSPRLPWRRRLALWSLGLVFVGNAAAYFRALESVPASVVALLLYTYPILVLLMAAVLGIEPLTTRGLIAASLVVCGAGLTAAAGAGSVPLAGVALALLAAAVYAAYTLLGSRLATRVSSGALATHVAQAAAAVFALWAALRGELAPPQAWTARIAIVTIAVVCTVVALRAFLAGLARVGPARAAVASSLEAVFAVLLAVLFLGERLVARQVAGGLLILAGVTLHNQGPRLRGLRRAGGPGESSGV